MWASLTVNLQQRTLPELYKHIRKRPVKKVEETRRNFVGADCDVRVSDASKNSIVSLIGSVEELILSHVLEWHRFGFMLKNKLHFMSTFRKMSVKTCPGHP